MLADQVCHVNCLVLPTGLSLPFPPSSKWPLTLALLSVCTRPWQTCTGFSPLSVGPVPRALYWCPRAAMPNTDISFLTVLGAASPRLQCHWGWFLVGPRSLACRWPSSQCDTSHTGFESHPVALLIVLPQFTYTLLTLPPDN